MLVNFQFCPLIVHNYWDLVIYDLRLCCKRTHLTDLCHSLLWCFSGKYFKNHFRLRDSVTASWPGRGHKVAGDSVHELYRDCVTAPRPEGDGQVAREAAHEDWTSWGWYSLHRGSSSCFIFTNEGRACDLPPFPGGLLAEDRLYMNSSGTLSQLQGMEEVAMYQGRLHMKIYLRLVNELVFST